MAIQTLETDVHSGNVGKYQLPHSRASLWSDRRRYGPCLSPSLGLRFSHDEWKGLSIWGMLATELSERVGRPVLLNGEWLSATNFGLAGRHVTDLRNQR